LPDASTPWRIAKLTDNVDIPVHAGGVLAHQQRKNKKQSTKSVAMQYRGSHAIANAVKMKEFAGSAPGNFLPAAHPSNLI
jgi:hypothetical protein